MEIMFSVLLVLAMFYLFFILPMRSQRGKVRRIQAELQEGDEVVTAAGLIGQVRAVGKEEISLVVAEGVVVRVVRSAILQRLPTDSPVKDESPK